MRRRDFITLVGGNVLTWQLGVQAQQPAGLRRLGMLMAIDENEERRIELSIRDSILLA